jgi:hypothetical protein
MEIFSHAYGPLLRLDDVENKLADTEKEADKARKDSKSARDAFNDVKQRRYGLVSSCAKFEIQRLFPLELNCLTRRTTTFRSASTRCTRILPRARRLPWAASPISAWKTTRYGRCVPCFRFSHSFPFLRSLMPAVSSTMPCPL